MKHIIYIMTAMLGMQGFCTNAMTTITPENVAQEKNFFRIKLGNTVIVSIPLLFAQELSPLFKNMIKNPTNLLYKTPYEYDLAEFQYSNEFVELLKYLFTVVVPHKDAKASKKQGHALLGSQASIGLSRAKKSLAPVLAPAAPELSVTELLLKSPELFYELLDFVQQLQITYFEDVIFQVLPRVAGQSPKLLETPLFKNPDFCAHVASTILSSERYAALGIKDPIAVSDAMNMYSTFSPRGDYYIMRTKVHGTQSWSLYKTYPKKLVDSVGQKGMFSKDGLRFVATNKIAAGTELNLVDLSKGEKSTIRLFIQKAVKDFAIDATARVAVLLIDNYVEVCELTTGIPKTTQLSLPAGVNARDIYLDDAGNTALIRSNTKNIWLNLSDGSIIMQFDDQFINRCALSPDGSLLACYNFSDEKIVLYDHSGQQIASFGLAATQAIEFSGNGRYVVAYTNSSAVHGYKSGCVIYDTSKNAIVHQAPCYIGSEYASMSIFQDPAKQYFVYYHTVDHKAHVCDLRGAFTIIESIPVAEQQGSNIIKAVFFGPTINTILFGGHDVSHKASKNIRLDCLYAYNRTTKWFKHLFADLDKKMSLMDLQHNNTYQLILYEKDSFEKIHALVSYGLQYFNPEQIIAITSLIELSYAVQEQQTLKKPQKTTVQRARSFLTSEEEQEQHSEPEEKPLIDANSWLYKVFKTLSATEQQRLLDAYPALKQLMPKEQVEE